MSKLLRRVTADRRLRRQVLGRDLEDVVLLVCKRLGRLAHSSEIIARVKAHVPDADGHQIRHGVLPRLYHQNHLRTDGYGYYGPVDA